MGVKRTREEVLEALRVCGWSVAGVAEAWGVRPTAVYAVARRLGMNLVAEKRAESAAGDEGGGEEAGAWLARVCAELAVQVGALASEVERLAGEVEIERRISAVLSAKLEAMGKARGMGRQVG